MLQRDEAGTVSQNLSFENITPLFSKRKKTRKIN